MSYGVSAALQTAVYQALSADVALSAVVGSHIYDALPSGICLLYTSPSPRDRG